MRSNKPYFLAILSILFTCISACNSGDDKTTITPVTLVDSQLFASINTAEIKTFVQSKYLPISTSQIRFDVDIYKVTYKTSYKNNSINASGLVALPKTSEAVGIFSFQHGTITAQSDAPSAAKESDEILKFYGAMSSVGFVGVVPDFIGFGASKDIPHPYYVEEATANAVLDNIRAAMELAIVSDVNLNKRLFLAGYSQGGYATMATHKAIELNGLEDLKLIASFPASGGYDVKNFQEYFFGIETYHEPFYMAYVVLGYKNFYDWTNPLSTFFKEPYASKIPGLFNGINTGSQINAELTENIKDLVPSHLLTNINTDLEYKFIADAFIENSLTDWTPKIPMYMYHGTADITVPYQNSVYTYNKLIQNGASPTIVTLTDIPLATHGTGVTPYILELTNKILALK